MVRMVARVIGDPSPSVASEASVVGRVGGGASVVVVSKLGDGGCPMGFAAEVSKGGVGLPMVKLGEFVGPHVGGDGAVGP
jgi:hypothetical protein